MISEVFYMSISFGEIDEDTARQILESIVALRGTHKGMSVHYEDPIPVDDVEE